MRATTLLSIALFASAVSGQGIALLEGPDRSNLSLRVLDELQPAAPGSVLLQNLEIMPVEITGRTVLQELLGDGTRLVERNGMSRVELAGGGRLFHYRRLGGQQWGFLLVPADGTARVVLELPGRGAAGTATPFEDRIAVSADGRNAAVPLLAGGLRLLRLDGSVFASTNAPSRAVALAANLETSSVMVGASNVFFATEDDRLWRLSLADTSVPADVSPPPVSNGRLEDELAMSDDGHAVVCLYGPRDLERLWLVRDTGPAVVLPPPPSKYEEPDYLPEGSGHPRLLLNDDATRLLYVDGVSRDELFLLDVPAAVPPLQITGDPIFQPYIGTHILPRFVRQKLFIAIGDVNRMDWYSAEAAGSVVNLTQTGSALQPFPAGTLDPAQAVLAGGALLATEQAGAGRLRLRTIDLQTGASTVLHSDLAAPPRAGSSLAAPPADLLVQGQGGDRLLSLTSGAQLAATPPGFLLTPPSRGPQYSATWLHLASGFGMPVIYLPDGSAIAGPFEQGVSQIVMTLAGGCVINGQPLRYLAPRISVVPNLPSAAVRICISGAGG